MAGHLTEPGDADEFHPSSPPEPLARQSPAPQVPAAKVPAAKADEPRLPTRGTDDTDLGWGADYTDLGWGADYTEQDDRSDDWYLAQRPPHH